MDLKIITKDLLLEAVLENESEEERGKIDKSGINLLDIKVLKLDFLNIYKIDHMWMMSSLQKLILTYNRIETIENLDSLVNLIHLDLSFNKIKEIQNLENLVKLEILFLNHNLINKINNMDELENLTILSLSGNLVDNYEEVLYLRKFKNLKVFSFDGNPCFEDPMCEKFILATLPSLKYLNYKLVNEDERTNSEKIFCGLIMRFGEQKEEEEILARNLRKLREETDFNNKIFIGNLKESLNEMLSGELKNITSCDPDQLKIYRNDYGSLINKFSNFAVEQHELRKIEIQQFFQAFNKKQAISMENSRDCVKKYMNDKRFLLETTLDENIENIENMQKNIERLWMNLMTIESDLYEQCEEMRLSFEKNITHMIATMVTETERVFSEWRKLEDKYCNDSQISSDQSDKKIKTDESEETRREHHHFINTQELNMTINIKTWLEKITGEIYRKELKRHRDRVNEISHFIEYERDLLKEHIVQSR